MLFMVCPKCKCKKCAKNGRNSAKLQKYICKECKFTFCPRSKFKHICNDLKIMVLRMYLEGLGFRSIGRLLKISHVSAYNIVKKEGEKLRDAGEKIEPTEIVEVDEIHTYVGKKKLRLGVDGSRQKGAKVHQLRARRQVGSNL